MVILTTIERLLSPTVEVVQIPAIDLVTGWVGMVGTVEDNLDLRIAVRVPALS